MGKGALEEFAGEALKGVLSKVGDIVFSALFDEHTSQTLSEETFKRIQNIVEADKLDTLRNSTKTVLDMLFNASHQPSYDLQRLIDTADEVRNQIAGFAHGYKAAIPYWGSASALLSAYKLNFDRASAAPKSSDPVKGTSGDKGVSSADDPGQFLAHYASDILGDLLTYEKQMLEEEGLETFSTFKRYTLGENPYNDVDRSPLSYMGKQYRENVQKLLGIIATYDPDKNNADLTQRRINQVARPRYLINFFDWKTHSDKIMSAWDSRLCDRGRESQRCRFWMCFPIDEYQPIGDVCITSPRRDDDMVPKAVPYIRAIGEGKLAYPADYQLKWKDEDSGNRVDLSGWSPVPPEGFAPLASVINQSQEVKPNERCVVVAKDDVDLTEPGDKLWSSRNLHTAWDGATWRHPESAFGDAGIFAMGRTLDSKPTETPLGRFKVSALSGHPSLGIAPGAPDFDPGNWTETAGAYGTSGRWNKGYKVRYRIGFYSPLFGTIVGPWWRPTYSGGADAEGYYAGSPWACPTVTNISTDPSGTAVARIVYRQFSGLPPEVVGVITNNVDTRFLDKADAPVYGPPATAPTFDPGNWANQVPVAGSDNWVPGYKVRYAVSFYNAAGETPMGPWWSPPLYPGADSEGFFRGEPWAFPALQEIPVDSTNTATGRRIYRQFSRGALSGSIEMVHELNDNQTTVFSDLKP